MIWSIHIDAVQAWPTGQIQACRELAPLKIVVPDNSVQNKSKARKIQNEPTSNTTYASTTPADSSPDINLWPGMEFLTPANRVGFCVVLDVVITRISCRFGKGFGALISGGLSDRFQAGS